MQNNLVIIPTYNEKDNIEDIILHVFSLKSFFEILIVDDNSPDGTIEIIERLRKTYPDRLHLEIRNEKSGLGTAYIHGFKWALNHGYEFIFEMDADFSHNPDDLEKLLAAVKNEGYDMAIGSRYINGVNVVNWPISRVLISYFASTYVKFVTGMKINDTTAGFKCYKRRVLEAINLDSIKFVGYAFQIEMKFKAWKYGFKIKEVPIIFTDRTKGTSKMSSNIVKEAFLGVIKMKLVSLFKKYRVPEHLSSNN